MYFLIICFQALKCYQRGIEYEKGDKVPDKEGCNIGCRCFSGKIKCVGTSKLKGCGTRKKDCIRNNVLIPHLTVFPIDNSCNKCDCYDGKISCTNKVCSDFKEFYWKCTNGKPCGSGIANCGKNGRCKVAPQLSKAQPYK